jgi:hypothetical protein
MILLDTDHISVLQWEGEAAERLRRRMVGFLTFIQSDTSKQNIHDLLGFLKMIVTLD